MSHLFEEIAEQPEVLSRVTENFIDRLVIVDELVKKIHSGAFSNIVLTGMGASYYSCYPTWLKLNNLGFPISLWDTSELINFAPNSIRDKTLVIAVSQSGESAEIKRLLELKAKPGFTVGITNSTDNYLAGKSDLLLELLAGEEISVSTKTYLASLAVLHLLGSKIIGYKIAEEIDKLNSLAEKMRITLSHQAEQIKGMGQFLHPARQLTMLGRGFSLASANYGALILQEAAKFSATGLSGAQFRHGPMEIVNSAFSSVILAGSQNVLEMNQRLVKDIATLGGKVVVISSRMDVYSTSSVFPWIIPSVQDDLLPMLEIIPLQQIVISMAAAQGFEVGIFKNSGKVTYIE